MSEDIVDQTIRFIESEAIHYKKLRIYWFGGEPMVALPTIYKITRHLQNFCQQYSLSYSASIATNLSFLNERNYKKILEDLSIDKVEFAFDGIGKQHNIIKNYKTKDFDAFNHNLKVLYLLLNNGTTVLLRLNCDKSNVDGLLNLLDELCCRYSSCKNFQPYIAMIFPTATYSDAPNLIHLEEYTPHILNYIHILQKYGKGMEAYPLKASKNNCYGTNPNSIVIGVDGILTKCQSCPSSIKQSIGSIWKGIEKNRAYENWVFNNLIDECMQCPIYPICLGGCTDAYLSNSVSPCKKEKYYLKELLIDVGQYMKSHEISEYTYLLDYAIQIYN